MPSSSAVGIAGDTTSSSFLVTPSSASRPKTVELVDVTVRVLPSATKVTFFGVVTARVRPPRPSGWEREAESVAPSARMPRSCSARVDRGGRRPVLLGRAVDRDRQLASVAHRDVVAVAHRGGERGDHDVVRADGDVLLVEDVGDGASRGRGPRSAARRRRPRRPCRSGRHRPNRRPRRARRRPERHDEEVERTAQVLQRSCSPGTGVGRQPRGGQEPGSGLLRGSRAPRRQRRKGRDPRVVRGDPAPAIPSTVQDRRGEGQISVTASSQGACPTGQLRHTSPTRYERCVTPVPNPASRHPHQGP